MKPISQLMAAASGGRAVFGYTNNKGLDGWTVGGGIEYMWSPSWSVKVEYLFFDFSRNHDHADFVDATGATFPLRQ